MRLLWSLPKAVPAILRHLVAYVELAVDDLEQAHRDLGLQIVVSVVLGVALFFVLLTGCFAVLALTWDTPHRLVAIMWMGGVFFALALFAALYRANVTGSRTPFLSTVRREWAEDRVILERILSDHD